MILPALKNITTLIFDMDGTLIRSERMAKSALRNALTNYFQDKSDAAPEYTDEELMSGVGAPSNEFYTSLLPAMYKSDWGNFRDLVFAEESTYLQNHRVTYPGAISTLKELKKRGFTLALVSNCSREYFDLVMDTQNLRKYFDFAMCIGDEEGVSKAELFARIIQQTKGKSAVIGDRYYDVEAASANKLPTVGALYGYGTREELSETVTWVEDIRHLLRYFDPFYEICETLARYLISKRTGEHPLLVAIDTLHSSSAKQFVENLCGSIAEFGSFSTRLDLDQLKPPNQVKASGIDLDSLYPWQSVKKRLEELRTTGSIDVSFPPNNK
ncbi:HAD family hydrolase, partial [bacterium]|nr:HAD family hydrolase [bacterium]